MGSFNQVVKSLFATFKKRIYSCKYLNNITFNPFLSHSSCNVGHFW